MKIKDVAEIKSYNELLSEISAISSEYIVEGKNIYYTCEGKQIPLGSGEQKTKIINIVRLYLAVSRSGKSIETIDDALKAGKIQARLLQPRTNTQVRTNLPQSEGKPKTNGSQSDPSR